MLKFVLPSKDRLSEYFALCREYAQADDSRHRHIDTLEKAEQYIESDIKRNNGYVAPGKVRNEAFWVENEAGALVGSCRIRHELNESLLKCGGHIGYDVRPAYRRQGVGTAILGMALEHARSLGLQKVLVTCDDDNLGSIGVIENCGGVLENKVFDEEDQKEVRRYWIAL
mgnify:FL=1